MKQEDRKKLISSLGGIVSVVAGFIGAIKDFGVSPWIWGSALVVGALMAMAPYVRDIYNVIAKCITPLFTPDISWHNDGFAYMTIEARFRDNFNKTGYEFKGHSKSDDHYAMFCKTGVISADNLLPTECSKYRAKFKNQMKEYKVSTSNEVQYLFANTPFIFAEHYYFYHILKLFEGVKEDPWKTIKEDCLKKIVEAESNNRIEKLIVAYDNKQLNNILNQSVFSNSTDLSQTNERVKNTESYSKDSVTAYVINDIDEVQSYFDNKNNMQNKIIHIIVDNSGIELISDLILGAYMIENMDVDKVVYHHNILPIFVSDAVAADFDAALAAITSKSSKISKCIKKCLKNGKIVFAPDAFWNMPFPFKEMPKGLLDEFNNEKVGMIIVKGDLNYRRLVEDKKWRITKNIRSCIDYFNRPILILRSLKSDTLIGMDRATVKEYDREQPNWKITGDYGMIQFIEK